WLLFRTGRCETKAVETAVSAEDVLPSGLKPGVNETCAGNARKTTRCVRRSLRISICVHNPGTCRIFRGAAGAMIWAQEPHQRWPRLLFSKCSESRERVS